MADWKKIATQADLDLKANIASPTFTGTVSGITKSMVDLGNADNTSDANKPVSTATQTAIDAVQADVDTNESDADTAIATKMNLTGGTVTGDVTLDISGNIYIDADGGEARLTDDSNPGNTFVPLDNADITTKKYVDEKRFSVTTDQLNYRMGTVNYYYAGNQSLGAAVGSGDFQRYEAPYAVYTALNAVQVHSWTVYGSVSSSVDYEYELWDITNSASGGSGNVASAKIGSTQSFSGLASRMYTVGESALDYTLAANHQLYVVKRYTSGSGNKYTYATVTLELEVI